MSDIVPTPAIEARGLVKSFGTVRAVDGIDLLVPAGSVYGVLGPNGAGKTTTIRMLATLLPPDAGSARVFGHDIVDESDAVRGRMALMGQFSSVDQDLTGRENLILIGRLLGVSRSAARLRAADMLEAFGLAEAGDRQVKKYSGGMRRRLEVAATLVTTPDLIFLDEPTTGLDPHSRNEVWDLVRAVVQEGTTVLLTTQYLEEADQLADRIAIIDRGQVIAEGTTGELKSSIGTGRLRVRLRASDRRDEAREILSRVLEVRTLAASDGVSLTASVPAKAPTTRALDELTRAGLELVAFDLGEPSLDEVFLTLTGVPPTTAPPEGHETKEPA